MAHAYLNPSYTFINEIQKKILKKMFIREIVEHIFSFSKFTHKDLTNSFRALFDFKHPDTRRRFLTKQEHDEILNFINT